MDGAGIDVWLGTRKEKVVDTIICTVDLIKRDSEIKLLVGCTTDERNAIAAFHNESPNMKGILIQRDSNE